MQGLDFLPETCHTMIMEKTQTAINTIFGALTIYYYLSFADCNVEVNCEVFTDIDSARDCAFEISAETNRRIQIFECWGLSEHLMESVLA
jgi:hypothetical protein